MSAMQMNQVRGDESEITRKFGIRIGEVSDMPYGREVNIIDIAGVCWHFVE
jgi:hypothetical protein